MTLTKPYVAANSLWGSNYLAITLRNDWRKLKRATKPLNNSLATRGNAVSSILGPPIQPGALFYSIAGGITTRDTPEEETTISSATKTTRAWTTPPRARNLLHRSDLWSCKSISSFIYYLLRVTRLAGVDPGFYMSDLPQLNWGGWGACSPNKIWNLALSNCHFPAFWEHLKPFRHINSTSSRKT